MNPLRQAALWSLLLLSMLAEPGRAESRHFVVASLKPASPPHDLSELTFQHDPGRVAFSKVNVATLAVNATDLSRDLISGPGWIDNDWFEFAATTPPDTTPGQLREMFLHFLEERFAFKYHLENQELHGFALVVAPRGPKLAPARDDSMKQMPQGVRWYLDPPHEGITTAHLPNCSMPMLANALTTMINGRGQRGRSDVIQVENRTDLDGRYGITLDVENDSSGDPPLGVSPAAVRRAVQTQLGLTLTETKITRQIAVIDRIERTSAPN